MTRGMESTSGAQGTGVWMTRVPAHLSCHVCRIGERSANNGPMIDSSEIKLAAVAEEGASQVDAPSIEVHHADAQEPLAHGALERRRLGQRGIREINEHGDIPDQRPLREEPQPRVGVVRCCAQELRQGVVEPEHGVEHHRDDERDDDAVEEVGTEPTRESRRRGHGRDVERAHAPDSIPRQRDA